MASNLTTIAEVCRQLQIDKKTLYNWHKKGIIDYEIIGKRVIVSPASRKKFGIK